MISPTKAVLVNLAAALVFGACGDSSNDSLRADGGPRDRDGASADARDGAADASADGSVDGGVRDGGEPEGRIAAVVTQYAYRFDLATGEATSRVDVRSETTGAGCVALVSRLPLRGLGVIPGAPALVAAQTGRQVTVCGAHAAGTTFAVEADATVSVTAGPTTSVGFLRTADRAGNAFSYLLGWVEACDLLGPCDPAPDRFARFTFDVSHAAGEVVVCPGARAAGAQSTRCELQGTPAPTYSAFAIAANAAWRRAPLVETSGVSVELFEVPPGPLAAALDPALVGGFLEWMAARFGPFPYGDELRIATGPTAWLGMEHPANIIVKDELPARPGLYRNTPLNVVLHEIAHQWAGNRTTLASALDYVWKEAIAEYLVYAYEDERGLAEDIRVMRALWRSIGRGAPYPVRPLAPPAVELSTWTSSGYGSGPMTLLLQLEPWLGRTTLLEAVARFLAERATRSVDDLRVALEAASGLDLGRYFEAWVFGTEEPVWPIFDVTTTSSGSETTVTVAQVQDGGVVFPCVVEVEIRGPTQSRRVLVDFGLAPAAASASTRVSFNEPVTTTRVDPDGRLLGWAKPSVIPEPPVPVVRWHP